METTRRHFRDFYGCTASIEEVGGEFPFRLKVSAANGHRFCDRAYTTFRGALLSAANGKALDVSGMSHDDDAVIQVYEPNGTDAQRFYLKRLKKTADGVRHNPPDYSPFELAPSYDPSKRVEVHRDGDDAGAAVRLYAANGTAAQQWYVLDNGDGTITLLDNSKSKLALDVVGGGR